MDTANLPFLGLSYMKGGGLGVVTIEGETNIRDECPVGDNRATLNIRHCVNNIMSQLLTILQVPAHIMVTNDTLVLRAEVEYDKCGCR